MSAQLFTATASTSTTPVSDRGATGGSGSTPVKRVLVCGASFAGLSSAFWMRRLGYEVTVVELASELKKGGTPVDIKEQTVDIVKRMGLYDQIRAKRLKMTSTAFKNSDDETVQLQQRDGGGEEAQEEYEIERDTLVNILHSSVRNEVEWLFGDSVTSLRDGGGSVDVGFRSGQRRSFDLVLGCDGQHSVRASTLLRRREPVFAFPQGLLLYQYSGPAADSREHVRAVQRAGQDGHAQRV